MTTSRKINPLPFFANWSGHPVDDLHVALSAIKTHRPSKSIIYLAGDSSLDNKAWVPSSGPGGDPLPVNVPAIYHSFLDPATPKPDVAYWLNHYLGEKATCLNTAIEATMLRERNNDLLPQDEFIRDNITSEDILIISVGANDIAMKPLPKTIWYMLQLAWLGSRSSIDNGTASALKYFKTFFGKQTQRYVERLVSKQKPLAVIICMIYFPCEEQQSGWAETQLKLLGYDRNPDQLQAAIRKMYEQATQHISIGKTRVIPCALYEAMDGKDKLDYVVRVEPSVQGGGKIAQLLNKHLSILLKADIPATNP